MPTFRDPFDPSWYRDPAKAFRLPAPEEMTWHRPDPDGPDLPPHTGPRETCERCPQLPPEESLCGEEEALAAGSFGDPEEDSAPLPEQLRAWSVHVRGVARSRQKAYYEALSLAQMQFLAWQKAFPKAFALAAKERGWEPIGGREEEVLAMFSAGFAGFLNETLRIARDGG